MRRRFRAMLSPLGCGLRGRGRSRPDAGRWAARTGAGGPIGFGEARLALAILDLGAFPVAGERAGGFHSPQRYLMVECVPRAGRINGHVHFEAGGQDI